MKSAIGGSKHMNLSLSLSLSLSVFFFLKDLRGKPFKKYCSDMTERNKVTERTEKVK
jgi:hypothetical protein